jgi:hypothetical protein
MKNATAPGGPAANVLGLGDGLKDQVEAQIAERKKKLLQAANAEQGQGIFNPGGISTAAMALGLAPR